MWNPDFDISLKEFNSTFLQSFYRENFLQIDRKKEKLYKSYLVVAEENKEIFE